MILHLSMLWSSIFSGDPSYSAIDVVLRQEGKFSDHPSDPGGATNYGISLRFLKSLGLDIDCDGDTDIDDIRAIDENIARKIYREKWWDEYGYGRIPDTDIAAMVMSLAVNMGPKHAHRIVQQALNESVSGERLLEDGILGERTLRQINAAALVAPNELRLAVRKIAIAYYRSLVARNKNLAVFLHGWENRVNEVTQVRRTL